MQEYQQRVIDESHELGAKINNLSSFLSKKEFDGINTKQIELLKLQHKYMLLYMSVLTERIESFT